MSEDIIASGKPSVPSLVVSLEQDASLSGGILRIKGGGYELDVGIFTNGAIELLPILWPVEFNLAKDMGIDLTQKSCGPDIRNQWYVNVGYRTPESKNPRARKDEFKCEVGK